MKSEPDAFSIDDLAKLKRSPWDGVRNYTARNNMRAMKVGDAVLFYHSSCAVPAVVGLASVCRQAYPDATAWDPTSNYYDAKSSPEAPRWDMVDVEFVSKLACPVSLAMLKADPAFAEMVLVQRSRLSVQPCTRAHYERIVEMGRG